MKLKLAPQKQLGKSILDAKPYRDTTKQKEKAPSWMKEWHVKGNNEADALASAAAGPHEVPEGQANKIIKIYKDLDKVQTRVIQITNLYPHTVALLYASEGERDLRRSR